MGKVKENKYEIYFSRNKTSRPSKIEYIGASSEKKAREEAQALWPEMYIKDIRVFGESMTYKEIGRKAVKKSKADDKNRESSAMNGIQNAKGKR